MKIQSSILWHEGMPLAPQLYQQNDRRTNEMLSFYSRGMSPYFWGIDGLKTDSLALANSVYKITDVNVIMPDGLFASYSESLGHSALELDLSSFSKRASTKPLTLYLAVPKYIPGEPSVSGTRPRFQSLDGELVFDENGTGGDPIRVPRMVPSFKLLADKPDEIYTYLPIAQVQYKEDAFKLTEFVPPSLVFNRESLITQLCETMIGKVRAKATYMLDKFDPAGNTVIDQELRRRLNVLLPAIQPFEVLVNQARINPFDLYKGVAQVAAQLTVLPTDYRVPPVLPAYNHSNPLLCFSEIIAIVYKVLDQMKEKMQTVAFLQKDGYFGYQLPNAKAERIFVGAQINPSASESDTYAWVKNAIIVSESKLQSAYDRRILGAARKVMQGHEVGSMRVSRDVVLFEIMLEPEFVDANEVLYIFNPSDSEDTRPLNLMHFVESAAEEYVEG